MRKVHAISLGVALTLTQILSGLPAVAQTAQPARAVEQTAQPAPAAVRVVPPAPAVWRAGKARPRTAPAPAFWQALNDTTLDRLLDEAMRGSPQLAAAAAGVDRAGAARVEAALDLAPQVTASAGYTRRRLASASFPGVGGTLPDQGLYDSGLNASWELDVFGRVRNGVSARGALVGASREDLRDAQVGLAADVAGSYFALRGAQEQLAVARRNAENQQHTLDLTQTRLSAGRGTAFDTERARAQLSSTLAAIPMLEARVAALQHRIGVLLGRDPRQLEGELSAMAPFPDFPATVPSDDPDDVVLARPDVAGADAQLSASRSAVRSARADFLPRISLAANAGYLADRMGAFGNTGTFNFMLGPVISWAAFDIGRVKARTDQAQAEELAARARYDQTVLQAREELATASARYRAARERLALLRDASDASEKAANLARLRFEGGVADFLQVLDAERTLLAAQDQQAQAQADVADAYVALARANGAGWRMQEAGGR